MPDHNSQEGQGLIKVAVVHALSKLFNDTQLDGLSPIKHAMLSNRATRRQGTCRHHVDSARLKKGLSLFQLPRLASPVRRRKLTKGLSLCQLFVNLHAKAGEPGPIKGPGNAHRIEVNRI